jgi:two-component system, LuxR family, response regulator FixJ
MNTPYSVSIIGEDLALTQHLKTLFQTPHYNVTLYSDGGHYFKYRKQVPHECILIEFQTTRIDSMGLLKELKNHKIATPVIVLGHDSSIEMAVASMKEGAFDFMDVAFNEQLLIDSVNKALRECKELFNKENLDIKKLTPRELSVLQLVMDGLLNKQIAHELKISMSTVEVHRRHLRDKMNVRTNAELIKKCFHAAAKNALH